MSEPVYFSSAEVVDPQALPLAERSTRIGSYILEVILVVFTLFIGWFIWYLVVVGKGLTPARSILKLKIIDFNTRVEVPPGRAFTRGFLVYFVLFGILLSFIPFIILISGAFMFRESRQTLWDQITSTTVGQDR